VFDKSTLSFAQEFYQALLTPDVSIGEATRRARP
jgi:hypothetical protein